MDKIVQLFPEEKTEERKDGIHFDEVKASEGSNDPSLVDNTLEDAKEFMRKINHEFHKNKENLVMEAFGSIYPREVYLRGIAELRRDYLNQVCHIRNALYNKDVSAMDIQELIEECSILGVPNDPV